MLSILQQDHSVFDLVTALFIKSDGYVRDLFG